MYKIIRLKLVGVVKNLEDKYLPVDINGLIIHN